MNITIYIIYIMIVVSHFVHILYYLLLFFGIYKTLDKSSCNICSGSAGFLFTVADT